MPMKKKSRSYHTLTLLRVVNERLFIRDLKDLRNERGDSISGNKIQSLAILDMEYGWTSKFCVGWNENEVIFVKEILGEKFGIDRIGEVFYPRHFFLPLEAQLPFLQLFKNE